VAFWKLSELYELIDAKNCSSEGSAARKMSRCERQMLRMMMINVKTEIAELPD